MNNEDYALRPGAREMLAALWVRAMNNDATLQAIKAILAARWLPTTSTLFSGSIWLTTTA
jgi:hypothetical protein